MVLVIEGVADDGSKVRQGDARRLDTWMEGTQGLEAEVKNWEDHKENVKVRKSFMINDLTRAVD